MSTSDTTAAQYACRTPFFPLGSLSGSTTIVRCLVTLLLAGGAFAASAERSDAQELIKHLGRPDIGAGLLVYTISDTVETFPLLHGSLALGLNLPFFYLTDNLALGVNPNVAGSMQMSSEYSSSGSASLEIPVYLTMKLNTDATWKGSKSNVGLTAGIGPHYSILLFLNSGESFSYLRPGFMAEINFGSRRSDAGLYKLRFSSYIGSHVEESEDFPGEELFFNQYALQVLWTPGY